jgi:hypothetical protein
MDSKTLKSPSPTCGRGYPTEVREGVLAAQKHPLPSPSAVTILKLRLLDWSKIRIPALKILTLATARVAVFALGYEFCPARSTAVLGLSRH